MGWGAILFSFVGRIGRRSFWLASVCLFLLLLGYQYLTGGIVLIVLGYLAWSYIQSALLVKRLHDVNRSGLWALTPFLAVGLALLAISIINGAPARPGPLRLAAFSVPMACALGFMLGFAAWVGTKAGSGRDNRFGEPPLDFIYED